MVFVCDSLMGTGKTSAAIAYMNSHPEERFVYVTPYLTEAERIKTACPDLHFIEPSGKIPEYGFSKVGHTIELLKRGRNITTTHSAFTNYPIESASIIRDMGYTLILDESLSMLEKSSISSSDLAMVLRNGLVKREGDTIVAGDAEYSGGMFDRFLREIRSKSIVVVEEAERENAYLWIIPPNVIRSFKKAIIMTYMFSGQELSVYFKANDIQYQYIGVRHDQSGYSFTDCPVSDADLCKWYGEKIHVLDDDHYNSIGDDKFAMSMNWFASKPDKVDCLRKRLGGYFNYVNRKIPNEQGLWGTYSDSFRQLKGQGYSKIFLPFNARATNDYRDRILLAYPCNVFANARIQTVYDKISTSLDDERYALSMMLQWIWRSAIRDGKDVSLYLPSSRMRSLLTRWINGEFSVGGEIGAERSA